MDITPINTLLKERNLDTISISVSGKGRTSGIMIYAHFNNQGVRECICAQGHVFDDVLSDALNKVESMRAIPDRREQRRNELMEELSRLDGED